MWKQFKKTVFNFVAKELHRWTTMRCHSDIQTIGRGLGIIGNASYFRISLLHSKSTMQSSIYDKRLQSTLVIIFSLNPTFDHLLESFRWNDSYKWSHIGFCEKVGISKIKICSLSGTLHDKYNTGWMI